MNLGETFIKLQKSMQGSSVSLFCKLLVDDVSEGELICLSEAGSQSYERKGHLPKFFKCTDLKCPAQYSAERHLP